MSNERTRADGWSIRDEIANKLRRAVDDILPDINSICSGYRDAEESETQLRQAVNQQRALNDGKQKEINQLNASYDRLQTKCWNLESQVRSQRQLIEAMDAGMGGAWCRFWAGLFTKGGDE